MQSDIGYVILYEQSGQEGTMNVRERLIRQMQSSQEPVLRRKLILSFDKSRRAQAGEELSVMISSGYLNLLGTGRRGQPHRLIVSGTWPHDKCPMCGHSEVRDER